MDEDGESSTGSDSNDDDPDVHPLLRRCARNELDLRLGVPAWRRAEAPKSEPVEDAQTSNSMVAEDGGQDGNTSGVIGQNWTKNERHAFFRALRRCGKHPHNISKRVCTPCIDAYKVCIHILHAYNILRAYNIYIVWSR